MPLGNALPDLLAFGLHLVQQLFFIDAKVFVVINQGFTVDDHGSHIAADGVFHERSNGIAHRAKGEVAEIDDRNIGFGPSFLGLGPWSLDDFQTRVFQRNHSR